MIQRLRLWLAQWLGASYGYCVVRETPVVLLPSRVEQIAQRIRTSGHLGHRYHLRRALERDLAAISSLVEQVRRPPTTTGDPQ